MINGGENPEIVIIDGLKKSTYYEPLSEYINGEKISFASNFNYSRGYVGTWKIISNKLYLIELSGHIQKEGGNLNDTYKVGLDYLFNEKKIFAKWFSGEIIVNDGEIMEFSYRGSYPKFEYDITLSFENGELINKTILNNKTKIKEQVEITKPNSGVSKKPITYTNTDKIREFILEQIFLKLTENKNPDYVRENDIISHFSSSFFDQFIPNQMMINDAIYRVNSIFHFLEVPLIDYKYVTYKNDNTSLERAFFFNYGSTANEVARLVNGGKSDEIGKERFLQNTENNNLLCRILWTEKDGTFLFSRLKYDITPEHLANTLYKNQRLFDEPINTIYVFNSMFTNINTNEDIYLNINDFKQVIVGDAKIKYLESQFKEVDISNLNQYNFA